MHRTLGILVLFSFGCAGASSGDADDDTATNETGSVGGDEAAAEGGSSESGADDRGDDSEPVNPDSISNTPASATFTACPAPGPDSCTDCGLRVAVTRRRGWRADEYAFEILSEGNQIRCQVTLPCTSAEPVACSVSPGGPRVFVETEGCGGPESGQSITALRFAPDACPTELRIESYRAGIRTAVQDIEPSYATTNACGGECSGATASHVMLR